MKLTREIIATSVKEALHKILIPYGYKMETDQATDIVQYRNSGEWGFDKVFIPRISFGPENFSFHLSISRRIDIIEEIWEDLGPLTSFNNSYPKGASTLFVNATYAY